MAAWGGWIDTPKVLLRFNIVLLLRQRMNHSWQFSNFPTTHDNTNDEDQRSARKELFGNFMRFQRDFVMNVRDYDVIVFEHVM